MNRFSKAAALGAAVGAAIALVTPAAFAGGGQQSGGSGAKTAAPVDKTTPVTISYYYTLHPSNTAEQFADDAPGLVQLREKTGVTVKWQLTPGSNTSMANEKFNLLMADPDNLPDVVASAPASLKKYSQAWIPIDTIINANPARYPNLKKYILESDYVMNYLGDADGHIRVIPMLATRRIGSLPFVRQDLAAKYGVPDPVAGLVTLDQWHDILAKAKADGKVPYMTRSGRAGIISLLQGYMDGILEDYFAEDGKIKYGVLDPRFKTVVEIARQWYAEGLIDPEYPSTQTTKWWEGVTRGDVFATYDNIQRVPAANLEFINAGSPMRVVGVGPIQSPTTGKRLTTSHYPTVRDQSAAISVRAKYPERVLDYFEYCFSDEGYILMNFGVEGVSFSYVNGQPQLDPQFAKKVADGVIKHPVTVVDMPKRQKDELYTDYNTDREEHVSLRAARDLYADNPFIIENWIASLVFTDEEREILSPLKTDLDTYRSEWLDKFIMGVEPMTKWDTFTTQLQNMNLQQTITIYQAALDRLLK